MYRLMGAALLALGLGGPQSAIAQDNQTLGFGRLFTNDFFADGEDRWRSGGYSFSVIRGQGWDGARPEAFGGLLEYRMRSEVISPSRGARGVDDRPYVGAVSLGAHSHFSYGGADVSLGVDILAIGPQTGVSAFQEEFHAAFSMPNPRGVDRQLGNALHLTGTAEFAWPVRVSGLVTLRPFAEAQAGAEDMLRVGADVFIGGVGHSDLLLRDGVSGQLIRGIETPGQGGGYSFVAGADWAQVWSSVYLPEALGFAPEDSRWRARLGVHWQINDDMSFFYGATYLSEEFIGQAEGQVVGGLKLNFNF